MGLIDFIRRRRLTQQGLSSGKKRRTQADGLVASALDRSLIVRLGIYGVFAVALSLLIVGASRQGGVALQPEQGIVVALLTLAMVVGVFELSHREVARRNGQALLVFGGLAIHLAMIPAVTAFFVANAFTDSHQPLKLVLIPLALAPMVHSVLLGRNMGLFSVACTSLFGCFLVPQESMLNYLVASVLAGLTAVYVTRQVRKRGRLLRAGFYVGAVVLLVAYAFNTISIGPFFSGGVAEWEEWRVFGINSAAAFGTGLVTGMLVSGLLPILEGTFSLTTDISWLELSDLNHKLLRRMQLEAPGTFHHSLVVASLSEAAAESIGVNPMVCRVCSYFHDIGKLNKPEYFIENQGDNNPHDSLTPTMSALIIVAHVKDGVDLALKHKLNPRIIEVICEHHGDSLVYFFYRKAQEQRKAEEEKVREGLENPEDLPVIDEKNFRYPGPRPRSKESGIISLADAVESASRSLQKPTPQKIRSMIDDIVFNRIKDGQLDNCGLSVNELRSLRESFSNTLRSMMHSRIEYPKQGRKTEAKPGESAETETRERKPEGKGTANVVTVEELEKHRRKAAGEN